MLLLKMKIIHFKNMNFEYNRYHFQLNLQRFFIKIKSNVSFQSGFLSQIGQSIRIIGYAMGCEMQSGLPNNPDCRGSDYQVYTVPKIDRWLCYGKILIRRYYTQW